MNFISSTMSLSSRSYEKTMNTLSGVILLQLYRIYRHLFMFTYKVIHSMNWCLSGSFNTRNPAHIYYKMCCCC